jgi:hypothetical protein
MIDKIKLLNIKFIYKTKYKSPQLVRLLYPVYLRNPVEISNILR